MILLLCKCAKFLYSRSFLEIVYAISSKGSPARICVSNSLQNSSACQLLAPVHPVLKVTWPTLICYSPVLMHPMYLSLNIGTACGHIRKLTFLKLLHSMFLGIFLFSTLIYLFCFSVSSVQALLSSNLSPVFGS